MGRPTKLSDELRERYAQAVAAGVPAEVAARHLGFSAASLYRWLSGTTPRQVRFREAHELALANLEIRLTATVIRAAQTDPKLALELLERRFPARWRRQSSTGVLEQPLDRDDDQSVSIDPALIDEVLPKLLEAGRSMQGIRSAGTVDLSAFEDDGRSTDLDATPNDELEEVS